MDFCFFDTLDNIVPKRPKGPLGLSLLPSGKFGNGISQTFWILWK